MSMPNDNGEDDVTVDEFISGESALRQLSNIERMIDLMTIKLVEFRCAGLNEFTLKEIRILEGKLIKHFSQQLDAKSRVAAGELLTKLQSYPSLSKWLTVAGVSSLLSNALETQGRSVENLLQLSGHQLQSIVNEVGGNSEDDRKLSSSITQLKNYHSRKKLKIDTTDVYWDSWSKTPDEDVFKTDRNKHDFNENHRAFLENGSYDLSNEPSRNGSESSDSLPPDTNSTSRFRANTDASSTDVEIFGFSQHNQPLPSTSSSCLTPPSPSHVSQDSASSLDSDSGASGTRNITSSSPPPHVSKMYMVPPNTGQNSYGGVYTPPVTPGTPHKNTLNLVQSNSRTINSSSSSARDRVSSTGTGQTLGRPSKLSSNALLPSFNPLKPSKSSEWHVGNRIQPTMSTDDSLTASNQSLSSIVTLPPTISSKHSKPAKKSRKQRPGNLVLNDVDVPNFIHMSRTVSRRSSTTVSPEGAIISTSPLSPRTPMTPATPLNSEMWYRDKDLATHAYGPMHTPKTPRSGLKSVKAFFAKIGRKTKLKRNKSTDHILDDSPQLKTPQPESEPSNTRKRSSTVSGSKSASSLFGPSDSLSTQGTFVIAMPSRTEDVLSTSAGSSRSTSLVGTDRTLVPESSDDEKTDTLVRDESAIKGDNHEASVFMKEQKFSESVENLFRQEGTMQSASEEFDIPYDELELSEKIGRGRVGTVHKGYWHGDVAIRVIDIKHNDEKKLKAFKQEVMTYKKTRHENLELFMGSCMHPPRLAIVTGFCRGHSLYNYIRVNKAISVNLAKIIAQHIVQGMGYLHSKGIIHKDLKSKNIFIDGGKKVVITDFGLVGLHAVSGDNIRATEGTLVIPDGWLCYLAPEVIQALHFPKYDGHDTISTLPYTMQSDVFAFGTVWYELLSGSWPFNGFTAQSIIWLVGSGTKQNMSQLQGGKDVKEILMQSWMYDPAQRPDFSDNGLMGTLKRLQTQIQRSLSSHPRRGGVNRGISHERLFEPLRHAVFTTIHDHGE